MADARTALGLALQEAGRGGEAIAHFEAVLRVNPNLPEVRMNLATALEIAGRPAEAARRLGFPVSPWQP